MGVFTFFKLCKRYQITQRITNAHISNSVYTFSCFAMKNLIHKIIFCSVSSSKMILLKQTYRLNFSDFQCLSLRFWNRKVCDWFSGRAQVMFLSLPTERNIVVKENAMSLDKDNFEYGFKKLNRFWVDETRTPIFIHPFSSLAYTFFHFLFSNTIVG